MCYAIPGEVIEINNSVITVDYFGEKKKARNEFYDLRIGDYIYAQGGFVIQKMAKAEALPVLEAWQGLFVKLKEIDRRLAYQPKDLYQTANATRQRRLGNACCIHGIVEFSNYCSNDCLYCGIRKSNAKLERYRMQVDEIVEACDYAVNKLGFKALVLQSGEDLWYTTDKLESIVKKIRERCAVLLALSIGGRDIEAYEKFYQAGARAALLRFETSNRQLYERYRPGHVLQERINLIRSLKAIGYLIMTGFLIGPPGQTQDDILNDIETTASLGAEMFSFGPFIPHPQTPLADSPAPSLEFVLETIARTRIMKPDAKILATTALETLDKENGLKRGLLSGANSLMINVTPARYQRLYEIYPQRAAVGVDLTTKIDTTLSLLKSIGRAPVDLGA